MTKKDFELIARVLRTERATPELVAAFAAELWAQNTRFDTARFTKAATAQETK